MGIFEANEFGRSMKRLGDDDSEVSGTDYLAKTVLEEVEFTDTGCVDTEGNKIVLTKSRLNRIGFVRFDQAVKVSKA